MRPPHHALLVALAAAVPGCADGDGAPPPAPVDLPAATPHCRAADPADVEARVDAAIATLSLEDKVSTMAGTGEGGFTYPVRAFPDLGLPGLHMSDGPRGVSPLADVPSTAFPVGILRGATWDPDLEREVGAAIARELRAAGGDVLLAPTMNVLRHPRWGRAQETYGEDPLHVGVLATAFVEGVQSEGVLASAKHFTANSIENTRFEVDVTLDERALREVYLPHFRRVVRQGAVGSVMSAYNAVNGAQISANAPLLNGVLKGEWGFRGLVESDWVFGVRDTVAAANGGLDVEMPQPIFFGDDLVDAVRAGDVPEARIDDAVRRVFRAQLCFGLDADPPVRDVGRFPFDDHADLAREVAARGVVLLRNEGDLVPLDRAAYDDVVVVGAPASAPNLGDTGSSAVEPPYVVSVLEGLQGAVLDRAVVTHLPRPAFPDDGARLAAADAVVLVVGLQADDEGESVLGPGDRPDLALPRGEEALYAQVRARVPAGRLVVLLVGSGPLTTAATTGADALLWIGYPGMEGGRAVAEVLFGDAPPTGRLPFVWPVAGADLPPFDDVSLAVTYDRWHGHRYLDRARTAPRFPFGFGLATTELRLTAATLSDASPPVDGEVTVAAEVENLGDRDGVEVVQVYAEVPGSPHDRPRRALVGFGRVAVAPGQVSTVTIPVRVFDLAVWDTALGGWVVERRRHVLHVGTSAAPADQPLALPLTPR